MKPWEVIATLLTARQLRIVQVEPGAEPVPVIICLRTGKPITLENVRTIQVEHWPERHKHGGPVSPDNAIVSLAEGHKEQTTREKKADSKEDRIRKGRKVLADVTKKMARYERPTGFKFKKKVDGRVVRVPAYD